MKQTQCNPLSGAFLYAVIPVFLVILFLLSCAGTADRTALFTAPHISDTSGVLKAVGDVDGIYKGEKFHGKIAVVYDAGKSFNCDIYSTFAHNIASVTADKDSAEITIGDQEYRIGINDRISFLPFFNTFPFIFNDFVRITTGRLLYDECIAEHINNLKVTGGRKEVRFLCDSVSVSCTITKNGRNMKSIEYKAIKKVSWTLTCSLFKDGISRKIQYTGDEQNKFSVRFDSVAF